MAIDPIKKSSRLLQSRRYTLDTLTDGQEAFTQVLDLGSSEIYSQTNLIPTSSLPFSGSSQSGATSGVLKFWYRQRLTRGVESDGRQVWFFLDPAAASADSQTLQTTQVTNFISPKYSIPSLAASNTEISTPGYLATVRTSTDGLTFSDPINTNNYAFDYKTGVLQFSSSGVTPVSGDVYISSYQYVGRTLASDATSGYSGSFSGSFQGSSTGLFSGVSSGSFSGSFQGASTGLFTGVGSGSFSGSFQGNGTGLTNLPASSIVGLNLSQTATGSVSASVSVGPVSFQITSGSTTLLSLDNTGTLTVSGSEFIGNNITAVGNAIITGSLTANGLATLNSSLIVNASSSLRDATITGSLLVTQNLTVLGTASFTSVTSSQINIGASTITLSTDDPVVRFGGILVIDSGSFGTDSTGSLLWDSEKNHWIYANPSGSSYHGGGIMSGPRNTGSLGDETYPSRYSVLRGQGGDHLEGSPIYSSGSNLAINKGTTGSLDGVEIYGSMLITGSTLLPSPDGAVSSKYALVTSQSTWHHNANVGYPSSNNWQSGLNGSYFNNFTANTDVSEILRFVAGLLSASAPDAAPNTKTYGGISENISNNATTTPAAGYVPQTSTNSDINYLTSKGFTATGSTLYPGKTIYYQTSYGITYTSTAGGSTNVSSSADAQLFGLGSLTSGGPTQFNVSGAVNWFYSDNNNETSTATSQSQNLLSNNSFGTTNGLTLAKINTANPAVIPAAYQDGKFAAIFSSGLFNGARSTTNVSSSGWYHISASIRISSGSSPYSTAQTITERFFWAPLTSISIANNTKAVGYFGFQALSATSRSISGAPLLTAATWQVSSSVTGLFNPMFASSATIARQVITGNASISNPTIGAFQVSVTSGLINTANTVFDSTGVTVRATSTVPFETDLIKLTGSVAMSIGTGTNVAQSSLTPTTFTVNTFGTDRSGTEGSTLNTLTIPYFASGTFGQPVTSGSMAYFGGGTANTTLIEYFTSESFRRQIGTSTGLSTVWNETTRLTLGNTGSLQVKPGFLVNPESTDGYWYPTSGYNSAHYKWYLREFNTAASSNRGSLTIALQPGTSADLVDFSTTTTGKIAIGIIFQYQVDNRGINRVVMFDAVKGNGSYGGSLNNLSTSGQYNPFSDAIDVQADFSSLTNSAGTITLGLTNAINQTINASATKIWLAVRYSGTPTNALQRITVSTA
jgi:hypothetical protein